MLLIANAGWTVFLSPAIVDFGEEEEEDRLLGRYHVRVFGIMPYPLLRDNGHIYYYDFGQLRRISCDRK